MTTGNSNSRSPSGMTTRKETDERKTTVRQAGEIYWPVPVNEMVMGDERFVVLATICTFAERSPVAVGENATVRPQYPPTAMVLGQEFVRMKSPGLLPMRLI